MPETTRTPTAPYSRPMLARSTQTYPIDPTTSRSTQTSIAPITFSQTTQTPNRSQTESRVTQADPAISPSLSPTVGHPIDTHMREPRAVDEHPILRQNFFRSGTNVMTTESDKARGETIYAVTPKRHLPSLLEIRVEPPADLDPVVLSEFQLSLRAGCWNCDAPGHRYPECHRPPLCIFCFRCGKPGLTVHQCATCKDKGNLDGPAAKQTRSPF